MRHVIKSEIGVKCQNTYLLFCFLLDQKEEWITEQILNKYISYIGRIFLNNDGCQSFHFCKTYNKAKCYEKSQIFNLCLIGKKLFWKVITLENQHLPQIGSLFEHQSLHLFSLLRLIYELLTQQLKIHNWHSIKTLLTYVTHVFTKKITNSQSSNIFQQIIIHKPYMPKIILKTINFFFPISNHTKTATRQWKDSLNLNNILKEA